MVQSVIGLSLYRLLAFALILLLYLASLYVSRLGGWVGGPDKYIRSSLNHISTLDMGAVPYSSTPVDLVSFLLLIESQST